MLRAARNTLVRLACAALWSLGAAPAGAESHCVGIAEGDVLVVDLIAATPIIKVTDVDGTNLADNQRAVCSGGPITFPRSVDFDREGRMWISMSDGVVRANPAPPVGEQIQFFGGMPVPPRGILKERDGPIFLAFPDITGFGRILLIDTVTRVGGDYPALGDTGFPLGLIFDPAPGADPREMLLADSGNVLTRPAGLYEINEAGGVSNFAHNGALAI
ncbi:MAG: hypothetical protein JRH16_12345, partial [Deltaproteobacteria bacterium]|nr:hypothetical protein [Deltaproteobacteria bacterium]